MFFVSYLLEFNRYLNLLGIAFVIGIACFFSNDRKKINVNLILKALVLQFVLAILSLKTSVGQSVLGSLSFFVNKLYLFADEGAIFLFGNLAKSYGAWGFIFAFKVLPIIIFFGALTSLLFYLRVIQGFVSIASCLFRPIFNTSGAETLCAIANSFLGPTEAPLLIRDYLKDMTKSEFLVVMISGMATISGSVLAVYAAMGVPPQHLLTASVMAIPGSILMAKILYPEDRKPKTMGNASATFKSPAKNAIDAISIGTSDGLSLALNVGAMLISFLALLALINYSLTWISGLVGAIFSFLGFGFSFPNFNLEYIFGWVFAPFAYLLGFLGTEAAKVGQLLGTKLTLNELVAYSDLVKSGLSERTMAILTYALCGFANFSCIGIQIGGIGALVPEKRHWLTQLGFYALLGGSLSNLLSAMIAGLIL